MRLIAVVALSTLMSGCVTEKVVTKQASKRIETVSDILALDHCIASLTVA